MLHRITNPLNCRAALIAGALILGPAAIACGKPAPGEVTNPAPAPVPASAPAPAPIVATVEGEQWPLREGAAIDLAICLDTSGSMTGLIDAARQKLWDIVNDLATAQPTPELRVALLTYGNNGHIAENGWVRLDAPFTTNLDLISEKLFALTTNGGTEYVGRVLDTAAKQLEWSDKPNALKIMIVAGNESADQDSVTPFRDVCRSAIARGIMVDSIYCGDPSDGIAPGWREVATLAEGHFAAIDKDHGTIVIATPYDDELAKLSAMLNETYIPFGETGATWAANQVAQDFNAASMNTATAAQRCLTKAGALYLNANWDLVDACKAEDFKLEEIKDEDLPEAMRGMTIEQKREHVAAMGSRRAELQLQVAELNLQRKSFVDDEMKKHAESADRSFDIAILKAIRSQAEAKGFNFAAEPVVEPKDDTDSKDEKKSDC